MRTVRAFSLICVGILLAACHASKFLPHIMRFEKFEAPMLDDARA